MKIIKRLLILLVIACILWVGPIHPFRQVASDYTGQEEYEKTRPLEAGESIVQYFCATDNNLIQLEFAVDFDEQLPREGQLLFELLDADGNVVYGETYDYGQIPAYKYFGPAINVRLNKGKEYAYRLTNVDIETNGPCCIYTKNPDMCQLKKGRIGFAGEDIQGELITKITSNKPLSADNTLAIMGCIAMVGFLLYEILGRVEKVLADKKNVSTKNGKEESL